MTANMHIMSVCSGNWRTRTRTVLKQNRAFQEVIHAVNISRCLPPGRYWPSDVVLLTSISVAKPAVYYEENTIWKHQAYFWLCDLAVESEKQLYRTFPGDFLIHL